MIENWVKELVEGVVGGEPFKVGDVVKWPDGRTVKITGGRFWGEHGVSNHWWWKEVLPSGKLSKKEEHGYWRREK